MGFEQIKVELVDYMGSDLSTVNSARVSFAKESHYEACDEDGCYLMDKDVKLVEYLADHRHMTPFRHNAIQIRCAAPIFSVRQLGKHQAGLTMNEVSRRYVDTPPEFFTPDEWRGRPDGSIKQGSAGIIGYMEHWAGINGNNSTALYYEIAMREALSAYTNLLDAGVAPEMARIVLPQSMMTEWVWTGNLLAFAHVYKERTSQGAQLEARVFAEKLDAVIRPLFPVSWAALVDVKEDA